MQGDGYPSTVCAGSVWGRLNFPYRPWYGGMFCAGNRVGDSGMFSLLLSRAYSGLFCSSPHPTSKGAGGAESIWRGHSWDS